MERKNQRIYGTIMKDRERKRLPNYNMENFNFFFFFLMDRKTLISFEVILNDTKRNDISTCLMFWFKLKVI